MNFIYTSILATGYLYATENLNVTSRQAHLIRIINFFSSENW